MAGTAGSPVTSLPNGILHQTIMPWSMMSQVNKDKVQDCFHGYILSTSLPNGTLCQTIMFWSMTVVTG